MGEIYLSLPKFSGVVQILYFNSYSFKFEAGRQDNGWKNGHVWAFYKPRYHRQPCK